MGNHRRLYAEQGCESIVSKACPGCCKNSKRVKREEADSWEVAVAVQVASGSEVTGFWIYFKGTGLAGLDVGVNVRGKSKVAPSFF